MQPPKLPADSSAPAPAGEGTPLGAVVPPAELTEVIAMHRAGCADYESWERYAAGGCTRAQAEAAARAADHDDAAIARAAELFAPLGDEGVAAILAALDRDAGDRPQHVHAEPRMASGEVIRPRRWMGPALGGAVALVAAGLVLWVAGAPSPSPSPLPSVPPSPMVDHSLDITGIADVRGDAERSTPSVPVGAQLQWTLRPSTQHAVPTVVWACAMRDRTMVPLTVVRSPTATGATILASATLPAEVTRGPWELVAFASSVPAPATGVAACAVAPADHLKVTRRRFEVR